MKPSSLRWAALTLATGLLTATLSGCVVGGGGYGYAPDAEVGVGVSYYEPVGVYGGWGSGYQVGPYRDGGPYHGGAGGPHAYRAARPSRSMPSIPSRSRNSR